MREKGGENEEVGRQTVMKSKKYIKKESKLWPREWQRQKMIDDKSKGETKHKPKDTRGNATANFT